MNTKWWANPQTFNAKYQAHVNEYMGYLQCNDNYDKERGIYIPDDGGAHMEISRSDVYTLPPSAAEFYTNISVISKLYANSLYTPKTIRCIKTYIYTDFQINCLDWIELLYQHYRPHFYINCNLRSEHYGKILFDDISLISQKSVQIMYRNIEELIANITTWMNIVDTPPVFNIDEFLDEVTGNSVCGRYLRLSRREILERMGPKGMPAHMMHEMCRQQLYTNPHASTFTEYIAHRNAKN